MINNSKLDTSKTLDTMLESLNLLAIRDVYQKISEQVIKGQLSPIDYLQELVQIELEQRYQRTIMQLIK